MIPLYRAWLDETEAALTAEVVRSGEITCFGPYIDRFEREFASFCATRHAVSVANGTVAIHLALRALGIKPGDEVLVPGFTFVATANPVVHAGALPTFVDVDYGTWNMDPNLVEARVTQRTRAMIVVHLYGHPADMDPILEVARRYDLFVIEDAAEAHGALYKGRPVGGLGHIGCFSFWLNKIMTTGEGGMLTTNDAQLAEYAARLKTHFRDPNRWFQHPEVGFNYRMTNLQAAIGCAQLQKVRKILADRCRVAEAYTRGLQDVPELGLPPHQPWAGQVYWHYNILVPRERIDERDALLEELAAQGIGCRPGFFPLNRQPCFAGTPQSLPVTEDLARRCITLPTYYGMTEEEVDTVCRAIREWAAR